MCLRLPPHGTFELTDRYNRGWRYHIESQLWLSAPSLASIDGSDPSLIDAPPRWVTGPFVYFDTRITHHPLFANPAISLGFTALSLLLLVLVLLSVPGPIKGLYWFSIQGEQSAEGDMTAGVLGWCCKSIHRSVVRRCRGDYHTGGKIADEDVVTQTANCTYAPLSENTYLSTMIDSGQALTVRIMLPLGENLPCPPHSRRRVVHL